MRLDKVEMLVESGRATARLIRNRLNQIFQELETSSATRHLTNIDVCYSQLSVTAVGAFSLYESRLQAHLAVSKPFDDLQKLLSTKGGQKQAEEFENYRLAVNVLKHGKGKSHDLLMARTEPLPFQLQSAQGALVEEGDVCPPQDLIIVSVEFLEQCCDVIEKSWIILSEREAIHCLPFNVSPRSLR